MFCTKCGNEFQDGLRFCTSCGTKVAGFDPVGESISTGAGQIASTAANQSNDQSIVGNVKKYVREKNWTALGSFLVRNKTLKRVWSALGIVLAIGVGIVLASRASIESQCEKLFKETIQEKLLEEEKIDKYIELDKVENFKIEKDHLGRWSGTADVIYRAKHGDEKTMTFVYLVNVKETSTQLYLECKPKNEARFAEKFGELLESAGYEE